LRILDFYSVKKTSQQEQILFGAAAISGLAAVGAVALAVLEQSWPMGEVFDYPLYDTSVSRLNL
jgi:hypothetical protein